MASIKKLIDEIKKKIEQQFGVSLELVGEYTERLEVNRRAVVFRDKETEFEYEVTRLKEDAKRIKWRLSKRYRPYDPLPIIMTIEKEKKNAMA